MQPGYPSKSRRPWGWTARENDGISSCELSCNLNLPDPAIRKAEEAVLGQKPSAMLHPQSTSQNVVLQAAMGIRLKVLDPNENCPAASVAEQVKGDFSDFDTVRYLQTLSQAPVSIQLHASFLQTSADCCQQSYVLSAGVLMVY